MTDQQKENTDLEQSPNINNNAIHLLSWAPEWPSSKSLGGMLKEYVEGDYVEWRRSMGEGFNGEVRLWVDLTNWPYTFVVDFMARIPAFIKLTGFKSIDVISPTAPAERTDEQWHAETQRVLRSLNGPEVWISSDGGAVLSKQCIVTLIKELHMRAFNRRSGSILTS